MLHLPTTSPHEAGGTVFSARHADPNASFNPQRVQDMSTRNPFLSFRFPVCATCARPNPPQNSLAAGPLRRALLEVRPVSHVIY